MSPDIRRLSVSEVAELLAMSARENGPVALIDVREPYEFEAGHLEGSVPIPLGELRRRLDEIPRDRPAVFICRVGGRSFAACQLALSAGVQSPVNLEGGLKAWSREIDPTLVVV